ncbi:MAG TPA: ABC transporter ATP-binding protein [Methanomassiliicoccales archaeon]|nr:ABC transporter ATP-binding protein [Methanomassiliicoccales archaeon]
MVSMRLRVQGIEFAYNSVPVLKDVAFEAMEGEIIGVLGPNGSGKTTLLRCMNRALSPSKGTVLVEEKEIGALSRKEIANEMAVVPQNCIITFPFTALEIVLMGRNPSMDRFQRESKEDIEIVKQAMEATGVSNLAVRTMNQLSGGERQRVIIARALAQRPKIMLLDEPTLHLDVNHQMEIMELVRELARREKLTVIMVSHDLNLAARYCDKLILLSEGRVLAAGEVPDVLTQYNVEQVFKIRSLIQYDERIDAYSLTILGTAPGSGS